MLRYPALALALGVATAGSGASPADEAIFDMRISGIKAAELRLDTQTEGDSYRVASRIETTGLIGVIADYAYDGQATGHINGSGKVEPVRFVATSRSPRDERVTQIDWEDGTPVRVSVVPPRGSAPDPATQGGTLDPVSATVALLSDSPPERICRTSVDIFDGSRRSRLTLDAPVAVEGGYTCAGTYARLEGEAHTFSAKREYPFQLVFGTKANGEVELVRIETATRFGRAVVERRG